MIAIPRTPVPLEGLVPLQGGVWPVVHRAAHPVFLWLYTVHQRTPDHALVIWCNVSQEDILREMERIAKFPVGSQLDLGPFNQVTVLKRKWDFEKGQMHYIISGKRPGREWRVAEAELITRINRGETAS